MNRTVYPTARKGVELRQLVSADASTYFAAIDASREHLSQYGDRTAEKYPNVQAVTESIENPGAPLKLRLGIWDHDTFVGSVNLKPIVDKVELGYWLDERYTGRGYATLAVQALAARSPRYTELFAAIHPDNAASKGVIERAGFRNEGQSAIADYYFYHHPNPLPEQDPVLYAQTLEQDTSHSVARIGLRGLNAAVINHVSDTLYEVEFGNGEMIVGGINHELREGVAISVPASVPYQDRGHVVIRATSVPAFDPAGVERLNRNLLDQV